MLPPSEQELAEYGPASYVPGDRLVHEQSLYVIRISFIKSLVSVKLSAKLKIILSNKFNINSKLNWEGGYQRLPSSR